MKLDWDQLLSGKLLQRWRQLSSGLQETQAFATPRCYVDGAINEEVTTFDFVDLAMYHARHMQLWSIY